MVEHEPSATTSCSEAPEELQASCTVKELKSGGGIEKEASNDPIWANLSDVEAAMPAF